MGLSPKMRFRMNRLQNRWEAWKAGLRRTEQAVTAEQKMCPSCRALVERGKANCPYCGQRLQVFAASPVGRLARRATPTIPVTGWLILANLVMFVLEYKLSGTSLLTNLMASPSPAATFRLGDSQPFVFLFGASPVRHQYWRWITACFLHGGLLHIGMNMWVLFDLGAQVEQVYGTARFLVIYFLANLVGFYSSMVFSVALSVGASAALFGLIGAMLAIGVRYRHTSAGSAIRGLYMRWVIYGVIFSFIPGVDMAAHLGGLAAGFGVGYLSGLPKLRESMGERVWQAASYACIVLTALSFLKWYLWFSHAA